MCDIHFNKVLYIIITMLEIAVFSANNVDPDQMCSVVSDMGLNSLPIILFRVSRLKMG